MCQRGVDENVTAYPYFRAILSTTRPHKEAEISSAGPSLQDSPLAPCGYSRKRALLRSTWIYDREPVTAGDGNCWPSIGWMWPGGSGRVVSRPSRVTLSFPVSLSFYCLSFPACLPAGVTSSDRKQMRSSDPEVASHCPFHHQGKASDIHFHTPFSRGSKVIADQ